MSGGHGGKKTLGTRALQIVGLAASFALLWVAMRVAPQAGALANIAAIGLFLTGGTLASELLEPLKIPHLTAYLLVGIIGGPHVLHLVRHDSVESLQSVNALALALIALAGGAELRIGMLKKSARSLAWATVLQCFVVLIGMTIVFLAASPLIPFANTGGFKMLIGIALLEGVLGITRSPSAALGVLSQTRAQGPIANFTLAFVMLSDVVVIVLAATVITLVRPMVEPGASFSMTALNHLGHEILGSVALGTSLGLLIVAYLKFIQKNFLVVLIGLGFGFTEVITYLAVRAAPHVLDGRFSRSEPLEARREAAPRRRGHGERRVRALLRDRRRAPQLAAPSQAVARRARPLHRALAAHVVGANRISTRLAQDPPALRRLGWSGLVSQAGVALGIASTIANANPAFRRRLSRARDRHGRAQRNVRPDHVQSVARRDG